MIKIPRGKKLNLIGERFGRLTVIDNLGLHNKKVFWLCRCDCGNVCNVPTGNLRSGNTTSCGCIHKDIVSKQFKTHGLGNSRLHTIWDHMKQRCYNSNNKTYKYYGARGIVICHEWLDDFMNFYDWAINNGYRDDLTIDRIDVNGNYEPNNCRWNATKQQAQNRRTNRNYTISGKTHCLKEWCEILNLNYHTVYSRLNCGWPIEEALELKERK